MIEHFGGDPEAVLKSRHPSDLGPASLSRIRRRRDRRVDCDHCDCRDSLSRHVTSESHETHALFCIDRFYTDRIVSRDYYIFLQTILCGNAAKQHCLDSDLSYQSISADPVE